MAGHYSVRLATWGKSKNLGPMTIYDYDKSISMFVLEIPPAARSGLLADMTSYISSIHLTSISRNGDLDYRPMREPRGSININVGEMSSASVPHSLFLFCPGNGLSIAIRGSQWVKITHCNGFIS